MLVKQFPDIHWLKAKIKENFNDRRALNNVVLAHKGWPTIVLNASTKLTERVDIKGPFSLFLNVQGTSQVQLDGKAFKLNDQCFTLSNFDQHYDLLIDNPRSTETLNIHFGEHFYFEALKALKHSDHKLLDGDPVGADLIPENFIPRTLFRDNTFNQLVQDYIQSYNQNDPHLGNEEALFNLFEYIAVLNSRELKRLYSVRAKKLSTKKELAKRLSLSRDFIHVNFSREISLAELSQVSCLSKFHFLRAFKEVFNCTPYQYIKELRLNKAMSLIRDSTMNLNDIAPNVGFENASSLSRFVHQRTTHYPSYFRN